MFCIPRPRSIANTGTFSGAWQNKMTDVATNLTENGTHRPDGPSDSNHSVEWSFDLDDAIVSTNDARTNALAVPPDHAQRGEMTIVYSGHADVSPTSGSKSELTILSDFLPVNDGIRAIDLAGSEHNEIVNANALFHQDTLVFLEAPLVG
jgi:hypothetical protein